MMIPDSSAKAWTIGTREGRWAGFGPYYAMFPVDFARNIVSRYSAPGDLVIDPFCGRGTTNYVAQVLGRQSFGCELNPVGWVFSSAKTAPARQLGRILRRIDKIARCREPEDFIPMTEFQEWAWCSDVLGFVNSARRNLDWRNSKIDRMVSAVLLVYLHAKIGGGLSNQMRQSKAMGPNYAVRWWKKRNMRPPEINAVEYLKSRVEWRYARGIVRADTEAEIYFGDARNGLHTYQVCRNQRASLVLTSPPYMGVTDYRYDNWIRIWALGGPATPEWSQGHRYGNREKYSEIVRGVFNQLAKITKVNATIVVRTDKRSFTLQTTVRAIRDAWPTHHMFSMASKASRPTQTSLFGDKGEKPGEMDLVVLPRCVNPSRENVLWPNSYGDIGGWQKNLAGEVYELDFN